MRGAPAGHKHFNFIFLSTAPVGAHQTFGRKGNMNDKQIADRLQDHFSHLDQIVTRKLPGGDSRRRGGIVMGFSELDRDLYFVWDVVGITCNAGMGAWIHYHINDEGWIDDASRAFEAIGHRNVGQNLKVCRDRYLSVGGREEDFKDEDLSEPVWGAEISIERDLYRHLETRGFQFHRPTDSKNCRGETQQAEQGTSPNRA